ncbi:hypothetical protein [Natrinema sp. DC36]|uniref:hypothetical protein n=1 Tax=Natrinema sp. DC36 TaxID=2878680 RepID=UPI001CEFED2B|nr:hypothetical protein [Natrinema sp. DC36]
MELTIKHAYSQGYEPISNIKYFEVLDDPDEPGESLYCEFKDGHEETFKDVDIAGGDAE